MKKIVTLLIVALTIFGCSKRSGGDTKLKNDTDSVAYVLGMNVGLNLMRMDSTLNIEAVCRGIRDVVRERQLMNLEEAETFFLGHMNHTLPEKAVALEEQWLADLAETSRDFARTRSGITYKVEVLGDQERIPTASRDSLYLRLSILSTEQESLYSSYERNDTLRVRLDELKPGLQESIKLIGEGGKVVAWIPAREAYGADGNEELNIPANRTLGFELELVKLDKYAEWNRR